MIIFLRIKKFWLSRAVVRQRSEWVCWRACPTNYTLLISLTSSPISFSLLLSLFLYLSSSLSLCLQSPKQPSSEALVPPVSLSSTWGRPGTQRTWSTSSPPWGFLSPVWGRLGPPSPFGSALRYWQPHESHPGPQRRPRSQAIRYALGSPTGPTGQILQLEMVKFTHISTHPPRHTLEHSEHGHEHPIISLIQIHTLYSSPSLCWV